jgi:hypothetical protein
VGKHDWQHIVRKNIIGSKFWGKTRLIAHSEKNHDFQHILGESMIQSKFWEKND